MSISQEKKDFIKKTAPGIHVYMATTYQADEISVNVNEPSEEYIRTHLLEYKRSSMGDERWWFSQTHFCKAVDTMSDDLLRELLLYFDNMDMCLCDVFVEACVDTEELTENEKKYEKLIMDGDLVTFEEFLSK